MINSTKARAEAAAFSLHSMNMESYADAIGALIKDFSELCDLNDNLTSHRDELIADVSELRKDAERYRWLVCNSFNRNGVTQLHVWVHEWHPHSDTGEPTEWKARIIGPAIDRVIDEVLATTEPKPKEEWK